MPQLQGEPPGRIAPLEELVNAFEFEAMAKRRLSSVTGALIEGASRKPFERITLRPRVMVNTTKLDLSLNLFGQQLFTPIMIGPVAQQKRFHPEGELAMAKGAAAANATMVISSHSDAPLEQIAPLCTSGFWYQLDVEPDMSAAAGRVKQAVSLGAHAVCLTLTSGGIDWGGIDRLRQVLTVPLVLKGIMSAEEAKTAVGKGIQGLIISSYTGGAPSGLASSIEVLPGIADAVNGRAPILIDGGFPRGADILKALALGARGVLIARPAIWGLAGYGADGVQRITEMLQTELARDMAMCGKPSLNLIDRTVVRLHRW